MIKSLAKIQTELNAPKNLYNKFGNFNYRSAEGILEALKPLLLKEKLQQTITDEIILIGDRYYVMATVTVTDGENEEVVTAYAREPESKKGMDSSQITGATSSYARKYALNGMWLIDDGVDSDTVAGLGEEEKPKEKAKAKATPPKAKKEEKAEVGNEAFDDALAAFLAITKKDEAINAYKNLLTNYKEETNTNLSKIREHLQSL